MKSMEAARLTDEGQVKRFIDELLQASTGKLDHMVIDVVGSLFDQILSDPKVPPQMARQIARLQLPVLRVALVDSNFFSSRRHPVRRFVNRIASLMKPETAPGKFAGWIAAPTRGINLQPIDFEYVRTEQ